MTGPLYLCSLLLMLGGVFGDTGEVKTVTVMEGESVTLQINAAEIQGADRLIWTFNRETSAIASVNLRTKSVDYADGRFRDRLKLDDQTGFLTITNIRPSDAGDYKLEISGSGPIKHKTFTVIVREVITVSVMKGESVTLPTDVNLQSGDVIQWKFNDTIIADLTGPARDERFRNSEVNNQTGDLIITDIRSDQSGDYEMKINSRGLIISQKIFRVNIMKMPEITVEEGDSFTLHSGVNIQTGDVLQWKLNGKIIAQLTGHVDKGFTLNPQTGDLRITNIRGDQSGDYEVKKIKGSSLISHRTFRVNVGESTRNAYREETYPALLTAVILLGIINTFMNE